MTDRFTGQEFACPAILLCGNFDVNLHNFRARNYDSDIGMFYATDPAGSTTSPYGYARQNPVSFIDPTGMLDYMHYEREMAAYKELEELNRQNNMRTYYYLGGMYGHTYTTLKFADGSVKIFGSDGLVLTQESDGSVHIVGGYEGNAPIGGGNGGHWVDIPGQWANQTPADPNVPGSLPGWEIIANKSLWVPDGSDIGKILGGVGIGIESQRAVFDIASDLGDAAKIYGRVLKYASTVTGVANALISWDQWSKNKTTGNFIKAVSNSGLALIRVNPFILVGVGIMDVSGASDWIYNNVGKTIDNDLETWNRLIRDANGR